MGDGHHGALVVLEEPLEPGDRLGVEMVRRLVEQEQVGRGEEQPAERDAAALAAGERRDVAVALGQPQRVHRAVERRVETPRVVAVDLLLHGRLLGEERVEVGVGLGEGGRDGVEAVEQVAQLADAVLDVAAHVLRRVELGLLLEEADRRAGVQLGDAGRRLLEPGHDPQQRRLAGAVRPEHADLRARAGTRARCSRAPAGRCRRTCRPGTSCRRSRCSSTRQATARSGRACRYTATAARSSTSRNARDHSARSPQPRHETMFPSTTAAPSTYSPPAISMSGASGPKPALRRPRRSPSAAGTWGPWQSVPTGFSSAKKCSTMRRDVRVDPDELGGAAAGDHERRVRVRIDVGEGDVDGARPPRTLDVGVPAGLEVVDDELDRARRRRRECGSYPASARRYLTNIVSRSSAASPARISTFDIAPPALGGWITHRRRRQCRRRSAASQPSSASTLEIALVAEERRRLVERHPAGVVDLVVERSAPPTTS